MVTSIGIPGAAILHPGEGVSKLRVSVGVAVTNETVAVPPEAIVWVGDGIEVEVGVCATDWVSFALTV